MTRGEVPSAPEDLSPLEQDPRYQAITNFFRQLGLRKFELVRVVDGEDLPISAVPIDPTDGLEVCVDYEGSRYAFLGDPLVGSALAKALNIALRRPFSAGLSKD